MGLKVLGIKTFMVLKQSQTMDYKMTILLKI